MEIQDRPAVSFRLSIRRVEGASRHVDASLILLIGLACAAVTVLIYDGRVLTLLAAPIVASVLFGLERREARFSQARFTPAFRRMPLNPTFFIAGIVALVLIPTLSIRFVSDDLGALAAFHNLSVAGFFKMFHTDLASVVEGETGQEVRPLFAAFYFLNYKLWGLNPVGYHILGICAHALNALLVFHIAKQLIPGNSLRAALAGLLFALCPVNSVAVSWVAGIPAEILPTLFYLLAFFFFMRYRSKPRGLYLALSSAAFLACLCIKEVAVTLPVMLVCFDLFERYSPVRRPASEIEAHAPKPFWRLIPAYIPFAFLLGIYLAWRQFVFSHTLAQDQWVGALGLSSPNARMGLAYFGRQMAHVARYLVTHYVFALRQLLLPFPWFAEGIVLGIYLAWALPLLRKPQQHRRDLFPNLCIGLVWFFVADLPLLAAAPEARHLYLPAVGPSIAVAFLALPTSFGAKQSGNVRLAGIGLLLTLVATQLIWRNEAFRQMVLSSRNEGRRSVADRDASLPLAAFAAEGPIVDPRESRPMG